MRKRTDLAMSQNTKADPDPDPEPHSSNLIAEFEHDLARILRSGLTRKRVPRKRSHTEKN